MEVDIEGLDSMDRQILLSMIEKFNGGPVGIETLAVAVSEDKETVEDVYEPFLIKAGFMSRTPRGRVIMPKAYQHLGLRPPTSESNVTTLQPPAQKELF
jgi:Holliday junction DNA helicase RuvB